MKFTHHKNIYHFANPISNNSDSTVVINNLHAFVEAAKHFNADYYENGAGEHNVHYLSSFILQNEKNLDNPFILGHADIPNE